MEETIVAYEYAVIEACSPYDKEGEIVNIFGDYCDAVDKAIELRSRYPKNWFWVAERKTEWVIDEK